MTTTNWSPCPRCKGSGYIHIKEHTVIRELGTSFVEVIPTHRVEPCLCIQTQEENMAEDCTNHPIEHPIHQWVLTSNQAEFICTQCGVTVAVDTFSKLLVEEARRTNPTAVGTRQVDPTTGAVKNDGGKLRFDLVPVRPLEQVVEILTFGSIKYDDRNWEKGFPWGRPFAATMRHLWAWWRGENTDPESGYSHLAHAAVNILFLLEFERTHPELDNRPKE